MESRDVSLNIVMTYPVKWKAYNILRDFVQNFYDAVKPEEWKKAFCYEYRRDERRLIMEIDRNGFSYVWLMHIGASTKTDAEDPHAGYFGEGFKIAALCAIRDYGWGIRMLSRDWEMTVGTMRQDIDGRVVGVLAYHIEDGKPEIEGSRLEISKISYTDYVYFQHACESFFYPDNDLFGKEICRTDAFAVYERSKVHVNREAPILKGMGENGIVYCSFQMMGTVPFPLVLCLHRYEDIDRDRNKLYPYQAIDVMLKIACMMPPDPAIVILERLKRYWYRYPKKRSEISVNDWSPVVNALIRRIWFSDEATKKFRDKYPNLLCAARTKGKKERMVRQQALSWKGQQGGKYRLVKDSFSLLGYDFLENVCRENGGLSDHIRMVNEMERMGADLMKSLARNIYGDFFGTENDWPELWIADNPGTVYRGMGEFERRKEKAKNDRGLDIRYRIARLIIDGSVFRQGSFSKAFSAYIHELCHAFGGDASERCSNGMTIAMEMMLNHRENVMIAEKRWNKITYLPPEEGA